MGETDDQHQPVPDTLRKRRSDAIRAQQDWLDHYGGVAAGIGHKVRDGGTVRRLNELGLNFLQRGGQVDAALNSAMTTLAGENCQCTR